MTDTQDGSPPQGKRMVIAHDQGGGGTFCFNCPEQVEDRPDKCPKCGAIFTGDDDPGGGFGGHDY